ncbi:MAG: XRE family transcriptional regulator [Bacteroidales bacterium]|nr:XRE family transcriptional regulator [Bacteroidales bacterium]
MDANIYIGQKIKAARKMRGWSLDELCDKLNGLPDFVSHTHLSKQSLSKYERGAVLPSGDTLHNLSYVFRLPVFFFLKPFKFTLDDTEYRKRPQLPKKELERITMLAQERLERYFDTEEICGIAQQNIVKTSIKEEKDVYNFAKNIREDWHLGLDGIVGVIETIESHGVKVIEIDTDLSFDGMSATANGVGVMIVNNQFLPERKRFTALHELGHLLMDMSAFDHDTIEKMCNLFASEMLLPREVFVSIMGKKRHDISLAELRHIQMLYGISVEALMYKARKENIISAQRYKFFSIKKNSDAEFREEVTKSVFPGETSHRQETLVYKAFNNELISASRAAELLGTDLDTIRKNVLV